MLKAFILTVATEGAAVFIIWRRKDYLGYSFLCNLLTNPTLNFTIILSVKYLGIEAYFPTIFIGEIIVVLIEGIVYHKLCEWTLKISILRSLGLNVLSLLIGLIMMSV
jgi:hypothetical protein